MCYCLCCVCKWCGYIDKSMIHLPYTCPVTPSFLLQLQDCLQVRLIYWWWTTFRRLACTHSLWGFTSFWCFPFLIEGTTRKMCLCVWKVRKNQIKCLPNLQNKTQPKTSFSLFIKAGKDIHWDLIGEESKEE